MGSVAESASTERGSMFFLDQIEELRKRLIRIIVTVLIISVFSLVFSIKSVEINGISLYLPYPEPFRNLASQLIIRIQNDVLPDFVKVIVIDPGQAFLAQIYMAIFMGMLFGMPMIAYQLVSFIAPALYPRERRMILRIIVPVSLLFLVGVVFSYLLVTPLMMQFLYVYAVGLQATPFITVVDSISFVLLFAVAFGLIFQLPLVMYALSFMGIVERKFWKRNWRYALLAFVILGAVITPDGSGITMWFIAGPMTLLYVVGYALIPRKSRILST